MRTTAINKKVFYLTNPGDKQVTQHNIQLTYSITTEQTKTKGELMTYKA